MMMCSSSTPVTSGGGDNHGGRPQHQHQQYVHGGGRHQLRLRGRRRLQLLRRHMCNRRCASTSLGALQVIIFGLMTNVRFTSSLHSLSTWKALPSSLIPSISRSSTIQRNRNSSSSLQLSSFSSSSSLPSSLDLQSNADDDILKYRVFILRHGQTDANANDVIQGSSDFSRLTLLGKQQAIDSIQALSSQYDIKDDHDDDYGGRTNDVLPTKVATATTKTSHQDGTFQISSLYCSPLRRAQETLQVIRDYHEEQQQRLLLQQQELQEKNMNSNEDNDKNEDGNEDDSTKVATKAHSLLQLELPPEASVLENLREIDFYDWEGCSKSELIEEFPLEWKAWKDGDPYKLRVYDTKTSPTATATTVESSGNGEPTAAMATMTIVEEKYPLLELWDRADQVWDEIFENEVRTMKMEFNNQEEGSGGDGARSRNGDCINNADDGRDSDNIRSGTKTLLIVAHGSLGQALLGTAMGWNAEYFRKYEFPNCGMVEIEWNNKFQQRRRQQHHSQETSQTRKIANAQDCSSLEEEEEESSITPVSRSTATGCNTMEKQESIRKKTEDGKVRPLAARWRWRWPNQSDWKTFS